MDESQINDLYQKCIEDLGYTILFPLQTGERSVYKVESQGKIWAIKIGSPSFTNSGRQLRRENEALALAQGISRVVKRRSFHQMRTAEIKVYVLVRDYVDGLSLGRENTYLGKQQQKMLEETVCALHQRGISNLDLYYGNVVLDAKQAPYLFDLGLARLKKKHGLRDFKINVEDDLLDLQKLCKDYSDGDQ